jgi:hypothetical protein
LRQKGSKCSKILEFRYYGTVLLCLYQTWPWIRQPDIPYLHTQLAASPCLGNSRDDTLLQLFQISWLWWHMQYFTYPWKNRRSDVGWRWRHSQQSQVSIVSWTSATVSEAVNQKLSYLHMKMCRSPILLQNKIVPVLVLSGVAAILSKCQDRIACHCACHFLIITTQKTLSCGLTHSCSMKSYGFSDLVWGFCSDRTCHKSEICLCCYTPTHYHRCQSSHGGSNKILNPCLCHQASRFLSFAGTQWKSPL